MLEEWTFVAWKPNRNTWERLALRITGTWFTAVTECSKLRRYEPGRKIRPVLLERINEKESRDD